MLCTSYLHCFADSAWTEIYWRKYWLASQVSKKELPAVPCMQYFLGSFQVHLQCSIYFTTAITWNPVSRGKHVPIANTNNTRATVFPCKTCNSSATFLPANVIESPFPRGLRAPHIYSHTLAHHVHAENMNTVLPWEMMEEWARPQRVFRVRECWLSPEWWQLLIFFPHWWHLSNHQILPLI